MIYLSYKKNLSVVMPGKNYFWYLPEAKKEILDFLETKFLGFFISEMISLKGEMRLRNCTSRWYNHCISHAFVVSPWLIHYQPIFQVMKNCPRNTTTLITAATARNGTSSMSSLHRKLHQSSFLGSSKNMHKIHITYISLNKTYL